MPLVMRPADRSSKKPATSDCRNSLPATHI
jgi:hypothetical protein